MVDYYGNDITYEKFLNDHLKLNRPCLISSNAVKNWPSFENWRLKGFNALSESYGDQLVSVALCNQRYYSDQRREEMKVKDVVKTWNNLSVDDHNRQLYIKDWHLRLRTNEDFYKTPHIFEDDWMNTYYLNNTSDDFRFVYVGSKDTFTGLHKDVYKSYSWSVNIRGRKLWRLFPPICEQSLRYIPTNPASEIVYDVRNVDVKKFRNFANIKHLQIDIVQDEGQIIFIPSGWYHQVENLSDCISINHNWCNSNCLLEMYKSMKVEIETVMESIEDVKVLLIENNTNDDDDHEWKIEWLKIVQDLTIKDSGWSWPTFFNMINYNTKNDITIYKPQKEYVECIIKCIIQDFSTNHQDELKYLDDVRDSFNGLIENF